eukprot:7676339-Prorocentrum_lima.AAC.1
MPNIAALAFHTSAVAVQPNTGASALSRSNRSRRRSLRSASKATLCFSTNSSGSGSFGSLLITGHPSPSYSSGVVVVPSTAETRVKAPERGGIARKAAADAARSATRS